MIREIQYLPQTDFVPYLNRFLVVFLFNCVSKNYIHFINMQNKKKKLNLFSVSERFRT